MDNLELKALELQASALDSESEAAGPAAVVAQQEHDQVMEQENQNVDQVRMIMDLAIPLLGTLYPSLPPIYTEAKRGLIAAALGPVLTKYDISLSDWGSAYKEEIGALMICGPVAWATVQGIKADIASRAEKSPKAAVLSASRYDPEAQEKTVVLG